MSDAPLPGLPTRRQARKPELRYLAHDARTTSLTRWVVLYALLVTPPAAAAAGYGEIWMGALVFGGLATCAALHLRTVPELREIVMRVADGVLVVERGPRRSHWVIVPLASLVEVELDTSTVQIIPGPESSGPPGGGSTVSRIVFVFDGDRPPLPLASNDSPHQQCLDDAARIRVFLRSHGWLPKDERAAPSVPAAADSGDVDSGDM